MRDESLRSRSVDLVLRTILEQMIWDFADIADDRQSDWLKDRKDSRKDDRLNIIDYQSHHWQWSSSMFIRYNSDFDKWQCIADCVADSWLTVYYSHLEERSWDDEVKQSLWDILTEHSASDCWSYCEDHSSECNHHSLDSWIAS